MTRQAFYLEQEDIDLLRKLVRREKNRRLRSGGSDDPDEQEYVTDCHLVYLPAGGIAPATLSTGTGTGAGDVPNSATCRVYRPSDSTTAPDFQPAYFNVVVVNPYPDRIEGDRFCPVVKDKFENVWYPTSTEFASSDTIVEYSEVAVSGIPVTVDPGGVGSRGVVWDGVKHDRDGFIAGVDGTATGSIERPIGLGIGPPVNYATTAPNGQAVNNRVEAVGGSPTGNPPDPMDSSRTHTSTVLMARERGWTAGDPPQYSATAELGSDAVFLIRGGSPARYAVEQSVGTPTIYYGVLGVTLPGGHVARGGIIVEEGDGVVTPTDLDLTTAGNVGKAVVINGTEDGFDLATIAAPDGAETVIASQVFGF